MKARVAAGILLALMAALMFGAARQDSATVDEPSHLAAGYLHLRGLPTRMGCDDHPPFGQMIGAFPLLFMDVKLTEPATAILSGELGSPWTMTWSHQVTSVQGLLEPGCEGRYEKLPPLGDVLVRWHCPHRYPFNSWYYFGAPESQMFGKFFLYGGANDGDGLLLAARTAQIAVTLLAGLLIFLWTRRVTKQDGAALAALAIWAFQPIALAYGHLTNTDMGVALGFALAIYAFVRFLEQPGLKAAGIAGALTAVALAMKFTALILGPVFIVLIVLSWRTVKPHLAAAWKMAGIFFLAGWVVTFVVYFTRWSPAPPPTASELATMNPPGWFQSLRPVLVPPAFFKGLALTLGHAEEAREAYLLGEWSRGGWWYYFPVALVLKSPVAFIILLVGGLVVFLRRLGSSQLLERASWIGATIYVGVAMSRGVNIGIRHLLPALPLFAIGIGCALARLTPRYRLSTYVLVGWQAGITLFAYPLFIQFMSEAAGGAQNGPALLIDSNFDWGQDAKRLKTFLERQKIAHIYLDYFGVQFSTEYLNIPNTRVNAETARKIQQGTLVVSTSQLMRPEWAWLRESHRPLGRVAHTLFVYQFP